MPEIHFIADDKGAFIGALGMLFDASGLLGAPRSKVGTLAIYNDYVLIDLNYSRIPAIRSHY